jgi:hypothetical protein
VPIAHQDVLYDERWCSLRTERNEHGTAQPPLDRLASLAEAYGTTPAVLLAAHDEAVDIVAARDRADAALIKRLLRAL